MLHSKEPSVLYLLMHSCSPLSSPERQCKPVISFHYIEMLHLSGYLCFMIIHELLFCVCACAHAGCSFVKVTLFLIVHMCKNVDA